LQISNLKTEFELKEIWDHVYISVPLYKKQVYFINSVKQSCGIYQYGKRLYDIIKQTPNIEYIYVELDTLEQYEQLPTDNIDTIIYNYQSNTMPWLNCNTIKKTVKNIGIPHESETSFFDILIENNPLIKDKGNIYSIPRPLIEHVDQILEQSTFRNHIRQFINEYTGTGIPIFGSFGFGFDYKGFYKIIHHINAEYEQAVIKFVITIPEYGGVNNKIEDINYLLNSIPRKPGIHLMITNEFFTNEELLLFLHSNTMNIFLYDTLESRGISSVIDYALSVKKPLGISNSYMFRHIYDDSICLYKYSVEECRKNSTAYCQQWREKWSNQNLIEKMRIIVKQKKSINGIFYNSNKSLCSIHESGKMVFDILKKSENYTLDYSEDKIITNTYDFLIYNNHYIVNNWITKDLLKLFKGKTFCIVTEVNLHDKNPIVNEPDYFDHYIVLDTTINETNKIHKQITKTISQTNYKIKSTN
jgi:hypothetical protein